MYNQNFNLLNSLYKNAAMGSSSISTILPKVHETDLKVELKKQLSNYSNQCTEISNQLKKISQKPKNINMLAKTYAETEIKISTMLNSTPTHIAEIMIQGTNMGIIEITKTLNANKSIQPELRKKAENMLRKEQQYIDKLKIYL